jgi:S1-C subfamily serine protease
MRAPRAIDLNLRTAARVLACCGAAWIACRAPGADDAIRSPEDLRTLEARIRAVAPKVRDCVVGIVVTDDKGMEAGSGSGTIISADGWVLTAGHVGQSPGRKVTVLLADGTPLPAVTVGQHFGPDGDVGLIKIDAGGRALPFAPLGAAAGVATGEVLVALGHPLGPERNPWRPPPLRVGHLIARADWQFALDAPLSPGDSGGGVFTLEGALVGVNSAASARPDMNLAATVESAKERMESLREGLASGAYLADPSKDPMEVARGDRDGEGAGDGEGDDGAEGDGGDAEAGAAPGAPPAMVAAGAAAGEQSERRLATLEALVALNDPFADSIVNVIVDSRDACLGTFVDDEGRVVTKASELGHAARRIDVLLADGLSVPGRVLAVDRALDLAILDTGVTDVVPVVFDGDHEPALGDAVVTAGRGMAPLALGFRSLGPYASGRSDAASRALLGVALRPPTETERTQIPGGVGQVVAKLMPASGAARAGIAEGDAIIAIDGAPLESAESAAVPLGMRAPGDEVRVQWSHAGERRESQVKLLRPPGMEMRRALSTGAELSRRATGFGEVIQHDGVVPAMAMGGPVLDSSGRVVGLNIARADRMKTYALSAARVKASVDEMLAKVARGEVLPPPDPAAGLEAVTFGADGFATLLPAGARVLGPTCVVGEGGAIEGWGDADDLAIWKLRVPAAGRYDFSLDAAGEGGGKLDVFVANDLMTVGVRGGAPRAMVRVGETVVDEAGDVVVRVQPLGRPSGAVMTLHGIRVQRTDQLRMAEAAWPLLRWKDFTRYRREWEREERRRRREEERKGGQP